MVNLREAQVRYDMERGALIGLSAEQKDLIISQAKALDVLSPVVPDPTSPYTAPDTSKRTSSSRFTNTIPTFGAAMI